MPVDRKRQTLAQQDGFVLMTAMMIMVILTALGIAALSTTSIELMVAGNERQENQLFYGAESGCRRGGQWLRNLQLDIAEEHADADQKTNYISAGNFSQRMIIRDVTPTEETNLGAGGSYPVQYNYQIAQDADAAGNLRQCRPVPGNNPNLLACFYEVTCTGSNPLGGRRVIRVVINKPTDFR